MKPNRLPTWDDLTPYLKFTSDETVPVELVVLRAHMVCEVIMYRLLSLRLKIEEEHLPPLQYFHLTKLALGGAYKDVLQKVLALNDLRNEYSHELDTARLEPAHGTFVRRADYFWPPTDVLNKPKEFAELRMAAVRAAAQTCIAETFCVFAELAAEDPEFSGDGKQKARAVTLETRRSVAAMRDAQRSIAKTFGQ